MTLHVFIMVISAMERSILSQIDLYILFESRVIKRLTKSEYYRIKKLIKDIEDGYQRPSHLTTESCDIAWTKLTDDFWRTLWLYRLPHCKCK